MMMISIFKTAAGEFHSINRLMSRSISYWSHITHCTSSGGPSIIFY